MDETWQGWHRLRGAATGAGARAASAKAAAARVDPRSEDFIWLEVKDSKFLSDDQVEAFNRDGFFVIEAAATPRRLDLLTREIDQLEAGVAATQLTLDGEIAYEYSRDAMSFVKQPSARSDRVREFLMTAALARVAHDLAGPDPRLYWDQAVYKKPSGGPEFPWHQDNGYTFTRPLAYVTCWVALSDADENAGCPWVIPGAHRAGVYEHERGPLGLEVAGGDDLARGRARPVPVSAGDIVVFSSLTPHRTGPNNAGRIRKALIAQYIADGAQVFGEDGAWRSVDDPNLNPLIPSPATRLPNKAE